MNSKDATLLTKCIQHAQIALTSRGLNIAHEPSVELEQPRVCTAKEQR